MTMRHLVTLADCPDWPMIHSTFVGNWANPIFELFLDDSNGQSDIRSTRATHMHVYDVVAYRKMKHQFNWADYPDLATVSWSENATPHLRPSK